MAATIETRPLTPADKSACEELVLGLPFRFGEQTGIDEILEAVRDHEGFVAVEDGAVTGFLTYDRADPRSAQITWLTTRHENRDAVERSLVEEALRAFAADGAELACVVLPAPEEDEEAYDAIPLYESLGFVPLCRVASFGEMAATEIVLARSLAR